MVAFDIVWTAATDFCLDCASVSSWFNSVTRRHDLSAFAVTAFDFESVERLDVLLLADLLFLSCRYIDECIYGYMFVWIYAWIDESNKDMTNISEKQKSVDQFIDRTIHPPRNYRSPSMNLIINDGNKDKIKII